MTHTLRASGNLHAARRNPSTSYRYNHIIAAVGLAGRRAAWPARPLRAALGAETSPSGGPAAGYSGDAVPSSSAADAVRADAGVGEQPQQHGPGFCACCRPAGTGEPTVQVITYVTGSVLEVETADGDIIFLDEDDDEDWDDDEGGGDRGLSGSSRRSSNGVVWDLAPSPAQRGPLVFVPDLVIPPPPIEPDLVIPPPAAPSS